MQDNDEIFDTIEFNSYFEIYLKHKNQFKSSRIDFE